MVVVVVVVVVIADSVTFSGYACGSWHACAHPRMHRHVPTQTRAQLHNKVSTHAHSRRLARSTHTHTRRRTHARTLARVLTLKHMRTHFHTTPTFLCCAALPRTTPSCCSARQGRCEHRGRHEGDGLRVGPGDRADGGVGGRVRQPAAAHAAGEAELCLRALLCPCLKLTSHCLFFIINKCMYFPVGTK